MIDADTTAGISGAYNIPADQDQDEATDPNTADVRTLDSFNPNERLLKVLNQYGVTTVQTAPGPRNPIAGRAGIFKTAGTGSAPATVEQLAIRQESAMVFNLGDTPKITYGKKEKAPTHAHEDGGNHPACARGREGLRREMGQVEERRL